jgi:23S rRNA (cytidine1920-2'-O)/16S rRNA (cytidine1409-2'-O)-methyltransferase
MRLDKLLAQQANIESRTMAAQLIKSGAVAVNGRVITKPSQDCAEEDDLQIVGEMPRFVSRGGLKLQGALDAFGIKLGGKLCADIGASTGGFTDCMLQNGAARVYAVDVGRAQLHDSLRRDSRVISLENTDVRGLALPEKIGFLAADLSFISLKIVLPCLPHLVSEFVVLIKPQFEAGREIMSRAKFAKNGVLKDEKIIRQAADGVIAFAKEQGFSVQGVIPSPIVGGDGNKEFLAYLSYS